METFNERLNKEARVIKRKPDSIESWFYNTIPIDKGNGTGKSEKDPHGNNKASFEDLF